MSNLETEEVKNSEKTRVSEATFFGKFKQKFLEGWQKSSKIGKIWTVFAPVLIISLIICFFATDLSAKIFNPQEYEVYEYAIKCVESELRFPNTAKYPSFRDCSINKSNHSTQIIVDKYKTNSSISNKSMKYAWDVSGYGTCENAMGMTLNYSFTVTVVLSESGEFWCYKCDTSL